MSDYVDIYGCESDNDEPHNKPPSREQGVKWSLK